MDDRSAEIMEFPWTIATLTPLMPALCSLLTLSSVPRSYVIQLCAGAGFLAQLRLITWATPELVDDLSLSIGYMLGMIPFAMGSHRMFFNDSPKWWRFLPVRLSLLPLVAGTAAVVIWMITVTLRAIAQYYQTYP